jgi:hypothetical protein
MIQNRVHEPEASATLLEDLLRRSRAFIEGVIADRIRDSLEHMLDWTFHRVFIYLTGAALFATAAVLAVLAGLEGLKQAGAPAWAAYLLLSFAGALGGSLLLRRPKRSDERHRSSW